MMEFFDVAIVGGGPAGMSAALVLGRCRRRVLLCDVGKPRNYASPGVHGFLTRDGILPAELRQIGREELRRYGVVIREELVTDVAREACDAQWPAQRVEEMRPAPAPSLSADL